MQVREELSDLHTRRPPTIDSPDDEHWVARNMYRTKINTLKSASSWLLTRIVPRCMVNKI